MQQDKHPLETISDWLEERGIAVIDNVTRMPVYGEPYISPNLVIALNHRGWMRADYDMHPIKFEAHDNAVIYPGHIIVAHDSSDDYLCTLLVVSKRFLNILSQLQTLPLRIPLQHNFPPDRQPVRYNADLLQDATSHQQIGSSRSR